MNDEAFLCIETSPIGSEMTAIISDKMMVGGEYKDCTICL